MNYKKIHDSSLKIMTEINTINKQLKKLGYFTNTIDSIKKKDTLYIAFFSLGKQVKKATITLPNEIDLSNSYFRVNKKITHIDIYKIEELLKKITHQLEQKGYSFAEVGLKNILQRKDTLFAEVTIQKTKKRFVDKIIIKGYDKISASYIKRFLKINKKTVFNLHKIKEISKNIQTLDFISEIKPPEILFSKDSTFLYIYLKKEISNSFDGFLNFSSNRDSKGIQANGYLDLSFKNLFHRGESFQLAWNNNDENRQELSIKKEIPFIFNSPLSSKASFTIYKQDSTFLNTSFKEEISYFFNSRKSASFFISTEKSTNLTEEESTTTIKTFNNFFIGSIFTYNTQLFYLTISSSIGKRTSLVTKTSQLKFNLTSSYLWLIDFKNSFYIKSNNGFLISNSILTNELFRVGGLNSFRGVNEQSIFTPKFSFFNTEYRYKTSLTSYLHSISDFGFFTNPSKEARFLLSLGVGYSFKKNNNLLNIGYITSNYLSKQNPFKNPRLTIKWISYF